MIGYPRRITRDQLGPSLRNTHPVDNPETDVGAETLNALFHQASGLNLAVATRASVIATWDALGLDFDIEHQEEAWNPRRTQLHPVLSRQGVGEYSYAFAASYLDETDVAHPTALISVRASAMVEISTAADIVRCIAWIDPANPTVVRIRLFDASGIATDAAQFWIEVA